MNTNDSLDPQALRVLESDELAQVAGGQQRGANLPALPNAKLPALPNARAAIKPFTPRPGEVKNGTWFPGGGDAGIAVPSPKLPDAIPFGLPPMS